MTDLRQANADALGHLVSMRNILAEKGPEFIAHAAALDDLHRDKEMAEDAVLSFRAIFNRINAAVMRLDPEAQPVPLEPPAPPTPPVDAYAGVMVQGDPVEALRTHRLGQVAAKARALATARFTFAEAARLQQLQSQAQAAQANAAPPLTDAELLERAALEADARWAVTVRDYADTLIDSLLVSNQQTLEAFDPDTGWPE